MKEHTPGFDTPYLANVQNNGHLKLLISELCIIFIAASLAFMASFVRWPTFV